MSNGKLPERWQIHGERSVYDSRWIQVALVDAEPPGGERLERHVVRLVRVAVAAIVDELDRVLMIWRYRFVPGRFGWELPGGIVETGESAEAAAARETEEETGWRPVALRDTRHDRARRAARRGHSGSAPIYPGRSPNPSRRFSGNVISRLGNVS
jgi:8-oxo-dGTP pyrophosphatase MutT (NUDIX family)